MQLWKKLIPVWFSEKDLLIFLHIGLITDLYQALEMRFLTQMDMDIF